MLYLKQCLCCLFWDFCNVVNVFWFFPPSLKHHSHSPCSFLIWNSFEFFMFFRLWFCFVLLFRSLYLSPLAFKTFTNRKLGKYFQVPQFFHWLISFCLKPLFNSWLRTVWTKLQKAWCMFSKETEGEILFEEKKSQMHLFQDITFVRKAKSLLVPVINGSVHLLLSKWHLRHLCCFFCLLLLETKRSDLPFGQWEFDFYIFFYPCHGSLAACI